MVTFGERVRELRRARKWTQNDLADRLGLDRTTISKWERQGVRSDIATIDKLANVFDVNTDYLGPYQRPHPYNTDDLPNSRTLSCRWVKKNSPPGQEGVMDFIQYVKVSTRKG